MLCGMGVIGCVRGFVVLKRVVVRVAYEVGVCSGSSILLCMCAMRGV